jgi:hypothetical protein
VCSWPECSPDVAAHAKVIEVEGGSHSIAISRPIEVVETILEVFSARFG